VRRRQPPLTTAAIVLPLLLTVIAAGCKSDGRTLREPATDQTQSVYTPSTTTTIAGQTTPTALATTTPTLPFTLNLPWLNGATIDTRFTCNGIDAQPRFGWLGAPAGAAEMALVVSDVNAGNFVHWIITGLDPADSLLDENEVPIGAIEGENGFNTAAKPDIGWRGPCPPAGVPHTYRFTLYALDQQVELPTGSPAADLLAVIEASAIGVTQVDGIYQTP
jgi:Raf kinase inhibitor-like YbhB/YbcL family protein